MAFRVGQEVTLKTRRYEGPCRCCGTPTPLKFGEVYTVTEVFWDCGCEGLNLEGMSPLPHKGFHATLFRPVQKRKTSIECFTALLNTKSVEELVW